MPMLTGEMGVPLQLPSGYRFRPTDAELIKDYLLYRASEEPLPYDYCPIAEENDIYKVEPWLLAGVRENEDGISETLYFFTKRVSKRTTNGRGYWRPYSEDKNIVDSYDRHIGFKRTLIYYKQGCEETNWMMNEYSLRNKKDEQWVICEIQSGSPNTNSYGKEIVGAEDRTSTNSSYKHMEFQEVLSENTLKQQLLAKKMNNIDEESKRIRT